MAKVNPYMTFNGNCEEAFCFYKFIFGGEFLYMGRYKDLPPADKQIFRPENDEKIMHVSLLNFKDNKQVLAWLQQEFSEWD